MGILGLALFAHISHMIYHRWHAPVLIVKSHDGVMKALLEEDNKHTGSAE
jgi:hypothetical protein